jgi:hypothetical protein
VQRVTSWSARHPWRVLAAWGIALVLAIGTILTLLEFTSDGITGWGTRLVCPEEGY